MCIFLYYAAYNKKDEKKEENFYISTLFFVFTNSMQYMLFKRIAYKRFSRNYSRL